MYAYWHPWFLTSGTINSSLPCWGTGHLEGRGSFRERLKGPLQLLHINLLFHSFFLSQYSITFFSHLYHILRHYFFVPLAIPHFSLPHLSFMFFFFSSIVFSGLSVWCSPFHLTLYNRMYVCFKEIWNLWIAFDKSYCATMLAWQSESFRTTGSSLAGH